MIGSRAYLDNTIQSMTVTYSRFPGCTDTGFRLLSTLVITLAVEMTPI